MPEGSWDALRQVGAHFKVKTFVLPVCLSVSLLHMGIRCALISQQLHSLPVFAGIRRLSHMVHIKQNMHVLEIGVQTGERRWI